MQNIPRIYLNESLESGKTFPVSKDIVHYLRRVMRRNDCLVFNAGVEYSAELSADDKYIIVGNKTEHVDPCNDLTLCFAPIKKMDDLLNMVTQMGIAKLQPVITERTVANHINWDRMKKIIVEAAEQSNRNSVPELLVPVKFDNLDLNNLIVADERFAHGKKEEKKCIGGNRVLVGPEGGFSNTEFEKLDKAGVCGLSLGKTILRAEVAAVVAVAKVLKNDD
jgi:16S rRNA (uracil1498-N3)-methyltransferase